MDAPVPRAANASAGSGSGRYMAVAREAGEVVDARVNGLGVGGVEGLAGNGTAE